MKGMQWRRDSIGLFTISNKKKPTTHKGKVVEARFKINGKGFHTRGSGHMEGHTEQRCTPVSMPIQKESEQAPGT